MKYKGRHIQRGAQLLDNCKKAKISKHEYGANDDRIFCYGLVESSTEELIEQCRECKACTFNL